MGIFIKLIPFFVIIFIGFIILLPIIIKNKKSGNTLFTTNPFKKYNFNYTFTDSIKIMTILIIIVLVCFFIYFILSKTLLKDTIERHNNELTERTIIVKNNINPIIETIYDMPIDIKFNRWIVRGTNYNTKPPFRYGTYEYSIFYQDLIENITVEWEIREGVMIIKLISRHLGKENEIVYKY